MGRLLLRVFTAAAVMSAVVTAAVVLWLRSLRGGDAGGIYVRRAGVRYTVRSEGGRLTLYEPRTPPPPGPRIHYTTATFSSAAAVRNDQVVWQVAGTPWGWIDLRFDGAVGTPFQSLAVSSTVWDLGRPRPVLHLPPATWATRELMAGLEDPDRFVAAHLALTYAYGDPENGRTRSHAVDEMPDGQLVQTINGLRVVLRRERRIGAGGGWICSARVDPAQLPAIRERWHEVLVSQVVSLPYWQLVVAALVLPAARVWGPRAWRRLRRRTIARSRLRRGLCTACVYSLAGNVSGVCPECGTSTAVS